MRGTTNFFSCLFRFVNYFLTVFSTPQGRGAVGGVQAEMRGVSYFYALEQNPCRDGYHVHALWVDCKNMRRTEIWDKWFHCYGRTRIEPVNSRDDVSDYCAKYVTKQGSWWNVNLLGHRHPAFKDFKLVME